jgi:uncharacterized membrane protein (DUF106 family)
MLIKLIVVIIVYVPILLFEWPRIVKRPPAEIKIYFFLVLVSFYLGANFIFELKWLFLYDAAEFLFGRQSQRIVDFLNVAPH